MTSRTANKIKQRRESLKENQTPGVVPKSSLGWFWILAAITISSIVYLSYSAYTSGFANELIIPIIVAVTVLLLLIIWYLPKFYIGSLPNETGKDFDREKERLKLEDDTRKTFAQIVGGIVILGGLVFTYNTFRLQQDTYRLQQEGQLTDRFTKAVAQIGDEKLEIRLGGLYALERIAKDSRKDHPTIMEILAAYIREKSKEQRENYVRNVKEKNPQKADEEIEKESRSLTSATDILAAIAIINRRVVENDREEFVFDLHGANLAGAEFKDVELPFVNLSDANLSRARFRNVNLSGANLSGANLSEGNLLKADFSNADFSGANFEGAHLEDVNLDEAKFTNSKLSKAVFFHDTFSGVILSGADFSGSDLSSINFSDMDLSEVNFSNARLSDINFLNASLYAAKFSGSYIFRVNFGNVNLVYADLSGADISLTNFINTNLCAANFENSELILAKGLTVEALSSSVINDKTILPEHIKSARQELIASSVGIKEAIEESAEICERAENVDEEINEQNP